MRSTALVLCALILATVSTIEVSGQTFTIRSSVFEPALPAATDIAALSLADFNGDGRLDFYYPGALYKQEADGTFQNVLLASGIDLEGEAPRGGVWGDSNLDGLLDLIIYDSAPGSKLFVNKTGGKFELGNFDAGLQMVRPPIGGFWRDMNLDGWLDFVAAYRSGDHALYTGLANGRFSEQGSFFNLRSGSRTCSLTPGDYDNDGDADLYVTGCTAQNELLNLSAGSRPRFSERAASSGVASGKRSIDAAWFDFDRDGWLDLLVASQYEEFNNSDNLLFHNQRNGRFVDVAAQAGISGAWRPTGNGPLVVADFDNDGWEDVYLPANGVGQLYHNLGDGTFSEVFGPATGLYYVSGVAQAGDFNNDGWMDLILPGEGILYNDGGDHNWVTIEVKDDARNRFGVGTTLRLTTASGTQTRVIEAGKGTLGHSDALKAHFGLGTDTEILNLEIDWPTGASESYSGIDINSHHQFVRGLGENNPPSAFRQTLPLVAGYVDPLSEVIRFEWEPAQDDEDISYILSISGPGTSLEIPDIVDPFFELSPSLLSANQVYEWSVRATDGHSVRYSGEERVFTFGQAGTTLPTFTPPIAYSFGLPAVSDGVARFVDIDSDGDLDLLFGGESTENGVLQIYQTTNQTIPLPNDAGSYTFKTLLLTDIYIPAVQFPKVSFGELIGDGNIDLIVSGISSLNHTPETSIYMNTGTDMVRVEVDNFPSVWGGAVEWGDVDGDGDEDVLLTGAQNLESPYEPITRIFLNDGSGGLADMGVLLPGLVFGDAAWSDIDGDGDLDIAMTGDRGDGDLFSAVYLNEGGVFTDLNLDLPGLLSGSVAWADFDLDGDEDLLLTGGKPGPELLQGQSILYINNGLSFSRHPFPFDGVFSGEAVWGDYENDGDPDLFIAGSSKPFGKPVGRLFRNENGQFAAELDVIGIRNASVAFGDYNGDGDMDMVTVGRDEDGKIRVSFLINRQIPELIPGQ